MKKLVKLILIAAILVGAIIGLMYIIAPSNNEEDVPDFASAQANEWKSQINDLCKEGKWTESGFKNIETGIHTDRVTSKGDLISMDEEAALQKYLFTASCSYLNKQVDGLFKQTSYPANTVKFSEDMLTFLNTKLDSFGTNSNLTEASNLLSEYHQLLGALSFSGNASYSRPLKAFNAMSADAAQSRVKSLKHYSSHFSRNPSIKSKVDNLVSNRAKAESDYYMNLEKAVENHYKTKATNDSGNALIVLLEDQSRFEEISTNQNAISRLDSFVKNPNR